MQFCIQDILSAERIILGEMELYNNYLAQRQKRCGAEKRVTDQAE